MQLCCVLKQKDLKIWVFRTVLDFQYLVSVAAQPIRHAQRLDHVKSLIRCHNCSPFTVFTSTGSIPVLPYISILHLIRFFRLICQHFPDHLMVLRIRNLHFCHNVTVARTHSTDVNSHTLTCDLKFEVDHVRHIA